MQESGEMYLESIYVLSKTNGNVRSIDIAEHLSYSKPSVSRAVGLLKNGGYIVVESDGRISLTESGLFIAKKTYERHTVLTEYFVHLGVGKNVATEDACKIEHIISDQTFNALKKQLEDLKK